MKTNSSTGGCRDSINTIAAICGKDLGKQLYRSAEVGLHDHVQAKSGIVSKSGGTSCRSALEEVL